MGNLIRHFSLEEFFVGLDKFDRIWYNEAVTAEGFIQALEEIRKAGGDSP